jgi:hypothetical protein
MIGTKGRDRSLRVAPDGFTLMETLVMLVLVSFAVLLMFQMLGSYRIASERVAAQSERIDRQVLFDAWFGDTVHGLFALKAEPLRGDALTFSGLSLNPLMVSPGAPTAFSWRLDFGADGWVVTYSERGEARWSLPLGNTDEARFVYFDADGEPQDRWPPALGLQEELPQAIALVREGERGGDARVRIAAVHGPAHEHIELYQPEED